MLSKKLSERLAPLLGRAWSKPPLKWVPLRLRTTNSLLGEIDHWTSPSFEPLETKSSVALGNLREAYADTKTAPGRKAQETFDIEYEKLMRALAETRNKLKKENHRAIRLELIRTELERRFPKTTPKQ